MLPHFIIQIGYTPLHYAAFNGRTEIVELLIQNGANLDALNKVTVNIHQ